MTDRAGPAVSRPWPQRSNVAAAGRVAMVGPGKGAGSGSAVAFPTLTGISGRYRADLGITKDGSNLVSDWADQSGNSLTLSEATLKPLWVQNMVNGLPAVRFDGVNDRIESGVISIAAPQTMVVVARLLSTGVIASLGNLAPDLFCNPLGTLELEKNGTPGTSVVVGLGWFSVIAVADAAASTFQLKNGTVAAVTNISATATTVALGNRAGASVFSNVEIAEFAFLSGAISAGDRAALLSYLQQTYGLW